MKLVFALAALATLSTATPGAARAVEPSSWPPKAAGQADAGVAPAQAARLYILSFSDAEIATVTEDVLGAALGLPYSLEPGVSGAITFKVEARMTPAQLLSRFEAALGERGLMLRSTGTQVVVSRRPPAALSATPAIAAPARPPSEFGRLAGLMAAFAAVGAAGAVWATWPGRRGRLSAEREAVLDYLVESGAATRKAVARARLVARREGGSPEQALERDGALPEGALVEAYCAAGGLAAWRPGEPPPMSPQPSALNEAPNGAIVALHDDGALLTVVTDDPLDEAALARVVFATGRTIRILVASPADLVAARQALSG